ncbi:MAG: hypothetical protein UU67_C0028G0005 [Candidatus Daviesbacteria bacterium GW2011_GWB1_41_5]|uniref:Uncharacterized protein n=1 Tax=Candidatus Daviesbacteria bacterium GW2011_GWB1_41_5 TaxID=1618429 RepID=A0A0G0WK95_9BACT|nr:MAG: hypothetical protein UU67_C0028G0005 [Candidatus Daviesbacteria bacterium GW2011_GWB1_41_5]
MGKQGQYNYKGVNAQAWAAMSLFLQYLRYTDFLYIQLEAPQFEDFNLVFNDGRKVICESKDWGRNFSFSDLKKVLKLILKKNVLGEKDEVLIICSNFDDNLKDKIHAVRYFEKVRQEFKKRGFQGNEIQALSKVKFWKISSKFNEKMIYSLFSELINFWLPQEDVIRIVDSILMQKIYKGSAEGSIFSREDIISEIENLRDEVIRKSGYIDKKQRKMDDILQELGIAIGNSKSPVWSDSQLSALSGQPELMFFVLDRLKDKKLNKLKDWSNLWKLYKVYRLSFSLFRIFENNLDTVENKKYILQFFKNNIGEIKRFYQHDFFDVDVVKITKKILEDNKDNKFIEDAFEIVKKLITERRDDFFYLKTQRDSSWERGEVAKLLQEVYKKAGIELKEKIHKLIINAFNLIEDDGEFSRYTPREIFEILRDWIENDFEKRLLMLVEILSNQYDKFYKKFGKKLEFQGWEHMGGMTSSVGHHYTVEDRHFIGFTLEPALTDHYSKSKNKNQAWRFIKKNCINKTKDVSKSRPDFLNRAILPIVLERYQDNDEKISNEAFEILKEFILSKKGIPHKSDLIYQALRGCPQLLDDKKWRLVEASTNKYGVPVSVFVEEIVSDLAKKGNPKAKKALADWLKNPKYYEKFRFEMNMIQNIRIIFENDFKHAVALFEDFINSDFFINKQDSFESYEIAILLYDILKKDRKRGLDIIKKLSRQRSLTKNQQIILCFSLFNYRGNGQSDDIGLIEEVYKKFINPFLNSLDNDINKIVEKLTFSQAREALVQFSERLARNKKIVETLRIVKVFINDPDPYLSGENPEDPENKYNEHQRILDGEEPGTITSTRGWCGWVLMKCSVLAGRDHIKELIDLTEQLTKDENWYVKHMACFALSQLAQNRLTVLPDNKEVLFFGKDKEEALERAKRVDIDRASDNVKKALAKSVLTAFDHIRILNEKDALTFVNTLKGFPDEAIAEAAPLFIFFAEFRKNAFRDWKWKTDKYYNDLGSDKYDDEKFKKILLEVIDKIEPKQRFSFAAQFEHLLRDLDYKRRDAERLFEIGYKYLDYLTKEYNHDLSNIIYMTIKNEMEKKHHFCRWHDLYLKYLEKEKKFYKDNFKPEKSMEMYWWPSYYNEDILLLIHQELGKDKFLEAFDIITQFPKELEVHASDKIVSLLEEFPKTNKTAKAIIGRLFEKNPSKYYELKNKWTNKILEDNKKN